MKKERQHNPENYKFGKIEKLLTEVNEGLKRCKALDMLGRDNGKNKKFIRANYHTLIKIIRIMIMPPHNYKNSYLDFLKTFLVMVKYDQEKLAKRKKKGEPKK